LPLEGNSSFLQDWRLSGFNDDSFRDHIADALFLLGREDTDEANKAKEEMIDDAQQGTEDRLAPADGATIYFDDAQAKRFFTECGSLGGLHIDNVAYGKGNQYEREEPCEGTDCGPIIGICGTGNKDAEDKTDDPRGDRDNESINQ
jgi:hypothetical protein